MKHYLVQPKLEMPGARLFFFWLVEQITGLFSTTCQSGKVFFIGLQPDGCLVVFERTLKPHAGEAQDFPGEMT